MVRVYSWYVHQYFDRHRYHHYLRLKILFSFLALFFDRNMQEKDDLVFSPFCQVEKTQFYLSTKQNFCYYHPKIFFVLFHTIKRTVFFSAPQGPCILAYRLFSAYIFDKVKMTMACQNLTVTIRGGSSEPMAHKSAYTGILSWSY